MKKDLFGFQTQGIHYDTFRPRYPPQMLSNLLTKVKSRNRYLDVATGTGQLLFELCHNFTHSEGLDISKNMIDVCRKKAEEKGVQGVEFRLEDFMKADVKERYDLITIGQALHWLPIREFVEKSKAALAPGGVLAVYGYILNGVQTDDSNFNKTLSDLYTDFYDKKVKKNFDFDRDELHTHYSDKARYPFEQIFSHTERELIQQPILMDKNGFISYLRTFSGYNTYLERYSEEADPLAQLEKQIPGEMKLRCLFDYFGILCME